jgi:hypothetical protein
MLNLTYRMLKLFAEGTLPATLVQELAAAAVLDGWGADDEVAQSLAGMGAEGKHRSNILRDLLRISKRLGMEEATPEPYCIKVPGPNGMERTVSVILPHEQLELVLRRDGLERYRATESSWNSPFGVGKLLKEWGDRVGVNSRDAVALGVHADGVSYTTSNRTGQGRSVAVGSWNIISAPLDKDRGKRYLYFAIGKASMCNCGCEGAIQGEDVCGTDIPVGKHLSLAAVFVRKPRPTGQGC